MEVRDSIVWGNVGGAALGNSSRIEASFSDVEGGYAGEGNIDANPLFAAGTAGTWAANAVYDADEFQTTLTGGAWTPGELTGRCVNPYLSQALQFYVVENDETTMTVWGDASALALQGRGFKVFDYHLTAASPCIDAGSGMPTRPDLDWSYRPFDVLLIDNNGTLDDLDMGAYEYGAPPVLAGDANLDCCVDGLDYVSWSGNYLVGHSWETGDFNGDLIVDGLDYAVWSNNYGQGCPAAPGPVPEPAALSLLAVGGLVLIRRKNQV